MSRQSMLNSKQAIALRKMRGIRHGRHCLFNLHIHLVFVPKYRKKIFTKKMLEALEQYFSSVCNDFDATLNEFNGEADHVHLLISYPPKHSVTTLVNSLKGVSARYLARDFPEIRSQLWSRPKLWSPSYFASSCGGASLDIIRNYIEEQTTPD